MSRKEEMQDKESQLLKAYFKIVVGPFQEKYEDMWEEEAYWEAVEAFKAESKKIGFEDPCEALNLTSFEKERNVGRIKTFIERKESLRYPSYDDTEGHLVRDLDNVTRYVGGPKFLIKELLGQVLGELYPIKE
ncbi:hypothetical protein BKA57DRAFT_442739 [Linnemannia elongata]|nr:hypothetical protein BKA57DRAFT_442739 [Linnemannia elongata]